MKTYRRILSLSLAVVLAIIGFQTYCFADTEEDYFEFITSNERMNANGTFYFETKLQVFSDYFKPDSSTITLYTHAHMYDYATDSSYVDSNVEYRITLFTASNVSVGYLTAKADSTGYTREFKNLNTSTTYYLVIAPTNSYDLTTSGKQLVGYGHIYDITLT